MSDFEQLRGEVEARLEGCQKGGIFRLREFCLEDPANWYSCSWCGTKFHVWPGAYFSEELQIGVPESKLKHPRYGGWSGDGDHKPLCRECLQQLLSYDKKTGGGMTDDEWRAGVAEYRAKKKRANDNL